LQEICGTLYLLMMYGKENKENGKILFKDFIATMSIGFGR